MKRDYLEKEFLILELDKSNDISIEDVKRNINYLHVNIIQIKEDQENNLKK